MNDNFCSIWKLWYLSNIIQPQIWVIFFFLFRYDEKTDCIFIFGFINACKLSQKAIYIHL